MATAVTAKSILTSTRRNLNTLASKVKTAVAKATGHRADVSGIYLGVERAVQLANSIVIEVYVEAAGQTYADPKVVLAAVKKASGCSKVRDVGTAMVSNPKGELFQFECEVSGTMTSTYLLPNVAFV